MDPIKETFDEVQAALLNSEQDPSREIFTAFCAVIGFADVEVHGEARIRELFDAAVRHQLKEGFDETRVG